LLLAGVAGGCVSKGKADAKARAAYMAGQQEALTRMQQSQAQPQSPSVTIYGEVRNRVVPWSEGLTLAGALLAADYCGTGEPAQIIIVRDGVGKRYDVKQVLNGADIPLAAGDVVQIIAQSPAPNQ